MADIERQGDQYDRNMIEITAMVILGKIKKENLSEENQTKLNSYLEFMEDDSDLRQEVVYKENQITNNPNNGRRIPLFTHDELAKAKNHRKKKVTSSEKVVQKRLFDDAPVDVTGTVLDPEKNMNRLHREFQSRFGWDKNKIVGKEINQKKLKLRDLIGLPIPGGKDPHVNDKFYKLLVKRIVKFDNLDIFREFDRVITDTPADLSTKINEVRGLIDELLNGGLNQPERSRRWYQFVREFKEKWGK